MQCWGSRVEVVARKRAEKVLNHLLQEFNTSLKVHTEIDEGPVNAFALVLFLFQNKHMVIEKLLQLFVGEIDTQLLKAVELRS